jgi:light-regulated signal transduction histidine kinase (bacteriophytochrome)
LFFIQINYLLENFIVNTSKLINPIKTCLALKLMEQQFEEIYQLSAEEVNKETAQLLLANQELKAANQKLLSSNQHLENFASIVSHDLQAPLRSLTMFAELLAQEYKSELDKDAHKYIEHITSSGFRMQTLIQDLLAYSRAGGGQQTWISLDLKTLLSKVTEDLQAAIAETQATIIINDLPVLWVNPTEISQLFQNLIENALKFRSEQPPRIEITATQQQEKWLISISDNGIGIESEFQEQIFQVFQRLHASEAYSGTGIGLAICQKIVQRYEGIIWVESELGKGSTFYFTLPINFAPQGYSIY